MTTSRLLSFFTLLFIAASASAGDRQVTLTSLSVSQGSVYFSSTLSGNMPTTIATPEPAPACPEGSNQATPVYSSVVQCQWDSLSGGSLTMNRAVNVTAVLKTRNGAAFTVRLSCSKSYGSCARPNLNTAYNAHISEDAKWLAEFNKRPVNGPMRVRLEVDGKKVTYLILAVQSLSNAP